MLDVSGEKRQNRPKQYEKGELGLLAAVCDQWVEEAQSDNPALRRRALEDFARAGRDPESVIVLHFASRVLPYSPSEILSALLHRVGSQQPT